MNHWKDKRALVVGGSAGLGLHIARALQEAGAKVAIAARNEARLQSAAQRFTAGHPVATWPVDILDSESVTELARRAEQAWGQLDLLVNAAGTSDRGRLEDKTPSEFLELFDLNFLGTLRCTQAMLPLLKQSNGSVINVGSLASKSASANLGAYPVSKFPVAAFSQQLRLEQDGQIHVLLVCPGPIRREDAVPRYQAQNVPPTALKPGGGVRLSGIDPERLAEKILRACAKKKPELVVPARARWLFAIAQLSPRLGDWIVRRMTS
jgi:short-subunit dehydrogenase